VSYRSAAPAPRRRHEPAARAQRVAIAPAAGTSPAAAGLLELQRLAGNAAVLGLLGVQRSVADELGTSPNLDRLARALDDDQESTAITAFGQLDANETDSSCATTAGGT
jgi:hypothetical protein